MIRFDGLYRTASDESIAYTDMVAEMSFERFKKRRASISQDGMTWQSVTVPYDSPPKTKLSVTRATLDTLRPTCFKVPMSILPITATLVTPHT